MPAHHYNTHRTNGASGANGGRTRHGVPTSFICAIDGKRLPASQFSNNQINKWHKQKKQWIDAGDNPANISLICKHHAMRETREVRCHGPCDSWKAVESFSKNQRNDPEPWCMVCTKWRVECEPGTIMPPPPNHELEQWEILDRITTVQQNIPSVALPITSSGRETSGSTSAYQNPDDDGSDNEESYCLNTQVFGNAVSMIRDGSEYDDELMSNAGYHLDDRGSIDDMLDVNLVGFSDLTISGGVVQSKEETQSLHDSKASTVQLGSQADLAGGKAFYKYVNGIFKPNADQSITARYKASIDARLQAAPKPKLPSTRGNSKWPKMDNRKVFNAPPIYACTPADRTHTRPPPTRFRTGDSDTDDSDSD
ncbi:Stc1 domain-containing protein [Hypomontagnella monticulosa]|nr:Stc1 domain-containing protein [Hypomontagnella monticulosa]